MAQVAAMYTAAPFARTAEDIILELGSPGTPRPVRPRPEGKRVWASFRHEPAEVIDEAVLDASSRDSTREKHWAVLIDANADQIARAKAAARRQSVAITIVLDLLHALEYLWKAAYVFSAEGSVEAERWVRERLPWLLCGE